MAYWKSLKSLKWFIKSKDPMCSVHSFQKRPWQFFFFFKVIQDILYVCPAFSWQDRFAFDLRQFGALPQMWGWAFGRAPPITSPRSGGFQRLGLAPKDNTQNYCCITNTPFSINFTWTHIQIFEVAPLRVTLRAQFLDDFVLFVSTVPGVSYHEYSQFSNLRYTNIINDFCS